jgi:hypothetical protein
MSEIVPAFPLASGALAPLHAKAQASSVYLFSRNNAAQRLQRDF